jgi:adenosylhomocysteine nucleosidase
LNKIGIIGAMDEEVSRLKEKMTEVSVTKKAGMEFFAGNLAGKKAVVVKSGIGKVNAGICTQILSDVFEVEVVINTGVAGSLKNEINIGDIVLSTDALYHDMDAVGFGYEPGVIPRMETSVFEASKELREIAKRVCERVNPEIQVFCGRVVSGDQFVSDHEVKERIVKSFGGYCTEMEGAAIAHAAFLNGIPFLIIRAISDKADNSATMDYGEFEEKAIEHTVHLVMGMMKEV